VAVKVVVVVVVVVSKERKRNLKRNSNHITVSQNITYVTSYDVHTLQCDEVGQRKGARLAFCLLPFSHYH